MFIACVYENTTKDLELKTVDVNIFADRMFQLSSFVRCNDINKPNDDMDVFLWHSGHLLSTDILKTSAKMFF